MDAGHTVQNVKEGVCNLNPYGKGYTMKKIAFKGNRDIVFDWFI